MRSTVARLLRRCFLVAFAATAPAVAAAPLTELSAAGVASAAVAAGPAVVVLWTPGCLACRKSLQEIERFAAAAVSDGITVKTVVPADMYDEARALIAKRGLALNVEADANRLDAASRRVLLDQPIAYAIGPGGEVAGARAGLLGAWILENLAADARRTTE